MPVKKPRPKKPIIDLAALDGSFKYCLEVDYSRSSCVGCQDYCRCTSISGLRVTDVSPSAIRQRLVFTKDEFVQYAVDRIIRHSGVLDPNAWTASACRGYYGEEVGDVTLNCEEKKRLRDFLAIILADPSPKTCVHTALMAEYGYLLDEVAEISDWRIIKVPSDRVRLPEAHGYHRLDKKRIQEYRETDLPVAVCTEFPSPVSSYRLIDGRHRFVANKDRRSVKIVYGIR